MTASVWRFRKGGKAGQCGFPRASGWGTDPSVHPQARSRKNRMSLTTEYNYRVQREYDDLYHWPGAREMVGKVK